MPDGLTLPRPPGAIGRMTSRLPWLPAALAATAYALLAALLGATNADAPVDTPPWIPLVLGTLGVPVAFFRRRHPLLMFAAAGVLTLATCAVGTLAEAVLLLLAVHAVGTRRSPLAAWICFGVGCGITALAARILVIRSGVGAPLWEPTQPPVSGDPLNDWVNYAAAGVVLLLIATLFGANTGQRRRYVDALVDRAARLARERDQQAQLAGARERERIAREMHDIIAHSLSVMVALSDGAHAAASTSPDLAATASARAAETGRRTLDEVRRLLGRVRHEHDGSPAGHAPQPSAAQLPDLVDEFQQAGMPLRFIVEGTPSSDPALGLTVYRIVQESLTNVLRHARDARAVTVRVAWTSRHVDITVDDDAPARSQTSSGGRGLLGMRERAALYDGTADAGPRPGGGWRVAVRLQTKGVSS